MNKQGYDDFSDIYAGYLNPSQIENLARAVEEAAGAAPFMALVKTRNKHGEPLRYFTVVEVGNERPLVFGGAIEPNGKGMRLPAVRVLKSNSVLRQIDAEYLFDYQKNKEWTCIQITDQTLDQLAPSLREEITSRANRS